MAANHPPWWRSPAQKAARSSEAAEWFTSGSSSSEPGRRDMESRADARQRSGATQLATVRHGLVHGLTESIEVKGLGDDGPERLE